MDYQKPKAKEYPQILKLLNDDEKLYNTLRISKKMNQVTTPWTIEELKENKQKREYRVLKDKDKVIGYASWKPKENDIVWISQFTISENYRRKGMGSKFLRMIENEAKNNGEYLVLEYWPDATWAENFYLKNGFKENPKVYKSKGTYTKVLVKKL